MDKQREYALKKLIKINENRSFTSELLGDLNYEFSLQEAGFIRTIIMGTIKNQIYMDYLIKKLSKVRFKKIHTTILNILRMSLFQLIYMEHIPESAIINEAVNLAKKYGHKASSGFVNGVLRTFVRNKEEYMDLSSLNRIERLSTEFSYPEYIIRLWEEEIDDGLEDLLKFLNTESEFSIRINTLLTTKEKFIEDANNIGVEIEESDISDDALIVLNPNKLINSELFKSGQFYIQSESSIKVGDVVDADKGDIIIDMCAAPGGKSTKLKQKTDDSAEILAFDIYEAKLNKIRENCKRLKINSVVASINDATVYNEKYEEYADIVLIDAPCSGFGLLRKKPEIKLFRTEEDIKELVSIQNEILNVAKNYVKVGGSLVYSTCTINRHENEENIEKFLKENDNFKLISIENQRYIKYIPNIHGTDGFFIAKLEKIS